MTLNPFTLLTRTDPAEDPAAFADLMEAAGDRLRDASEEPARLSEFRAALDQVISSPVAEPYGPARLRSAVLRVLGRAIDAYLSNHPGGPGEHEFASLVASVRSRVNALPVLRALNMGGARRKQLLITLKLHDQALQRVLEWGRANGLIVFRAEGDESHYFLTRRGELVVDAVDEPSWLHVAANLVREAVSLRFSRQKVADLESERLDSIAAVTGLTREAVRNSLDAMWRALNPARASGLAKALAVVAGERPGVLLFPPLPDEDRRYGPEAREVCFRTHPQVVLMLALERAGVLEMECNELPLNHFSTQIDGADTLELPLDRPVISMSLWSAVSVALAKAFGSPVQAHPTGVTIRARAKVSGMLQQHPVGEAGLVVRLFDSECGVTHVMMGGRDYRAQLAASYYFAERFEKLLAERPEESFAVLVNPDSAAEPRLVLTLDANPPTSQVQTLRWLHLHAPVPGPAQAQDIEPERRGAPRLAEIPLVMPPLATAGR